MFKTEASSKFPHYNVLALGSYKDSPFVTGQDWWANGLKTEILNYKSRVWEQAGDYPFSNAGTYGRYVSKDFTKELMKANRNGIEVFIIIELNFFT